MAFKSFRIVLLSLFVVASLAPRLAAQSLDKVKSDVLSALSTPLPITIIGPLLTRDVVVSEENGGFRAVLEETTLMGLFPFGEVSFHLAALDDETYRITDLRFANTLDFPGIGKLTFTGMELDGIWSSKSRSYATLKWVTQGLNFAPGEGGQGNLSIGSLSFDVMKEPDETNTESRFEIAASNLSVLGMGPQNVTVGEVSALLAANGDKPVDLYSVIREVLMLGSVRDSGAHLQTLGRSLLGNSYETVTMDLSASDLNAVSAFDARESYFKAGSLELKAALSDVEPRHWGGAEVSLSMASLDQKEFLPDSVVKVENAVVTLSGGNLPVADMMAAVMTLAEPPRRPVAASGLLDGLARFGKLEFSTQGKAVWVEAFDNRYRDGEYKLEKAFDIGYDSWGLNIGLAGLDQDAGKLSFGADVRGGRFVPGEGVPFDALPHIRAWFPNQLTLQTGVSSLNEALLRRMFADVEIRNLREPVELLLPLAIYAAATVFDVTTGENAYETSLFRASQSGSYRLYPMEVFNLAPYEGEMNLRLTGLANLLGYLDETLQQLRPGSDEATGIGAVKAGLIVLRNLAEEGEAGAHQWTISRRDVTRHEIELNGITLRYPNVMEYLPMIGAMAATF